MYVAFANWWFLSRLVFDVTSSYLLVAVEPYVRGIRDYLLHPLSLEDMRRTVEAALQRRWAEVQSFQMICRWLNNKPTTKGKHGQVDLAKVILFISNFNFKGLWYNYRGSLRRWNDTFGRINWPIYIQYFKWQLERLIDVVWPTCGPNKCWDFLNTFSSSWLDRFSIVFEDEILKMCCSIITSSYTAVWPGNLFLKTWCHRSKWIKP